MNSKIELVIKLLKNEYPQTACSLNYNSPLELLICTRLSAHCTDARVNLVSPTLFSAFKNAEDFAKADPLEVEKYVKSCGLYKVKSKNIVDMCKKINSCFNGKIPNNQTDLESLPGIGRKSANLILGEIYRKPGIIVDTHFIRVTNRLGFHDSKNPIKIEKIMKKIVPEKESLDFCHRTVIHGRTICKARKPLCKACVLNSLCNYYKKTEN